MADIASLQMIVDFKLLVEIQLIIDELQQLFKIACAHITSGDLLLLASSRAIVSVHGSGIFSLQD